MKEQQLTIGELADAAGLSRRAVRFYVQRGLLPPPANRGRGAHYDASHVARLRRLQELQDAGHSLASIARLLELAPGAALPPPPGVPAADAMNCGVSNPDGGARAEEESSAAPLSRVQAQLLVRLRLAEGVELQLDAARFNPDAATLHKLKVAVLGVLDETRTSNIERRTSNVE